MQMKEKKTSVFEIESIPKAVAVLAIPSVLSMLVTVLYNMVDTVFVGQTHEPLSDECRFHGRPRCL